MQKNDPTDLVRNAQRANTSGTDLLTAGASVGAMGLVGAALGAVCPVCVVATPALLGIGLLQKLRAQSLSRKAKQLPPDEPAPDQQARGVAESAE